METESTKTEGKNKVMVDIDFLLNIRGFVKAVYDYRPPVDVEKDAMPYNTCDNYVMELLMAEIDKMIEYGLKKEG